VSAVSAASDASLYSANGTPLPRSPEYGADWAASASLQLRQVHNIAQHSTA
jgi:hypothetical protein